MNYNSQYHLASKWYRTYFIVLTVFVSFGHRAHNMRVPLLLFCDQTQSTT